MWSLSLHLGNKRATHLDWYSSLDNDGQRSLISVLFSSSSSSCQMSSIARPVQAQVRVPSNPAVVQNPSFSCSHGETDINATLAFSSISLSVPFALRSFVSHCNYPVSIRFVNYVSNESPTIAGADVSVRVAAARFRCAVRSGPVCRGCYRVPFAGVGSFEINRTIVNLLESLPHAESKPMLKAKCALCKFEDTITVRTVNADKRTRDMTVK